MSNKRIKEIRNMSKDELASKLREVEAELFQVRMQKATGQLKDTSKVWRLKKDIARIHTVKTIGAKQATAKSQEKAR